MSTSPLGDTDTQNTISDLTYRNYDGPLSNRTIRWWVVSLSVIRTNMKKPGLWITAAIILLIFIFNVLIFFITNNVSRGLVNQSGGTPSSKTIDYASVAYEALSATSLLITIAALIVGSGSIAADNKANALLVYLSKPISKGDYLLGKWMGVFIVLAGLLLIPTFLMWVFFATTYADDGFFKQEPFLLLKLIACALITPMITTSLIIGFSSFTKNARLAGSLFAAFTFILLTLSGTLGFLLFRQSTMEQDLGNGTATVRRAATLLNASVSGIASGLSMQILKVDPKRVRGGGPPRLKKRSLAPYPIPLVMLGCLFIIVPVTLARARIRAVEVVTG